MAIARISPRLPESSPQQENQQPEPIDQADDRAATLAWAREIVRQVVVTAVRQALEAGVKL